MFAEWIIAKKPSVLGMISGAVAGLVAITPASGFVDPVGALIIGFAAGVVCYFSAVWVKRPIGYDDALDAWGVHGVGGALGAILTGVFASKRDQSQRRQGLAARRQRPSDADPVLRRGRDVCVLRHRHLLILKVLDLTLGLRVSREVEVEGLDINLHGETVHG